MASAAPDDGEMPNRVRIDGWTPIRQRAFLRALAETGGYSAACRAVGLSRTSADRMRRRYPTFAAACERALDRLPGTLEQVAFERAVEGWEEPIVHAGRIVGQRRRYSESLLRLLLAREGERERARAGDAPAPPPPSRAAERRPRGLVVKPEVTDEDLNAGLLGKLDAMERMKTREKRERMLAWAEEMRRRGLAP